VGEQRELAVAEIQDDVVAGRRDALVSTWGRLSRIPSRAVTTTPSAGARIGRPQTQ
jgi:hypothetical protein